MKTVTCTTSTGAVLKKPKIKSLKIIQPKRCIIVEHIDKIDGYEVIRKGSSLNCGACGGYLGTIQAELDFPFTLQQFKSRVENINFKTGKFGVKCGRRSCKAHLFTSLTDLVFTTFDNFRKTQLTAMDESKKEVAKFKREMRVIKTRNFFLRIYMTIRKALRWVQSWFFFSKKD